MNLLGKLHSGSLNCMKWSLTIPIEGAVFVTFQVVVTPLQGFETRDGSRCTSFKQFLLHLPQVYWPSPDTGLI